MKISESKLPSNKKFGFFFSGVFLALSIYFYIESIEIALYFATSLTAVFFIVSITKPEKLLPLNKLWMRFGFMLGLIVSPVVLGIIFFTIFMPIGILFRLTGRDELQLRYKRKLSYWIQKETSTQAKPFKNQF
jgi:hypothetical protein